MAGVGHHPARPRSRHRRLRNLPVGSRHTDRQSRALDLQLRQRPLAGHLHSRSEIGMSRMHVAVLGAGGFLGSHIVPGLRSRFDCTIDAIDVDLTKLEYRDASVRRLLARVEEPAVVEQVTSSADVVISLTALCNPAMYSTIPLEVIDANFTHLMPLVK